MIQQIKRETGHVHFRVLRIHALAKILCNFPAVQLPMRSRKRVIGLWLRSTYWRRKSKLPKRTDRFGFTDLL